MSELWKAITFQLLALECENFTACFRILVREKHHPCSCIFARAFSQRRLATRPGFGGITVFGVSILVFLTMAHARIMPGDPLTAIFGPEGTDQRLPEAPGHTQASARATCSCSRTLGRRLRRPADRPVPQDWLWAHREGRARPVLMGFRGGERRRDGAIAPRVADDSAPVVGGTDAERRSGSHCRSGVLTPDSRHSGAAIVRRAQAQIRASRAAGHHPPAPDHRRPVIAGSRARSPSATVSAPRGSWSPPFIAGWPAWRAYACVARKRQMSSNQHNSGHLEDSTLPRSGSSRRLDIAAV